MLNRVSYQPSYKFFFKNIKVKIFTSFLFIHHFRELKSCQVMKNLNHNFFFFIDYAQLTNSNLIH